MNIKNVYMKRLVVGLLFMFTSLLSFAGVWFILPQINIKSAGGQWSGWVDCNPGPIDMYYEPEKKKITIYSKTIQYIDYSFLEQKDYSDYSTLTGYATDSNYKTFLLQIISYNNGTEFLSLSYKDGEYMYVVFKKE